MKFLASIKVMPKAEVADPQGSAVMQALGSMGYAGVGGVRVGKFLEVVLEAERPEEASEQVAGMCRRFLSNPVIEDFSFELMVLGSGG